MNELPLQRPGRPAAPPTITGFALWQLGFRPFYLLAATFSALSIALWALQYSGAIEHAYLQGALWHGHEMLFGFTTAVIAGFLLTAVRNWANRPTPTGVPLAMLAALWVAGRVLVLTPWGVAAAVVNAAFPVAVAVAIGIPIVRAQHAQLLLPRIAAAARVAHARGARVAQRVDRRRTAVRLAARFRRGTADHGGDGRARAADVHQQWRPGANARRSPMVEKIAVGAVVLLFFADHAHDYPLFVGIAAAIAALANAVRLALWQPWRTLRTPLVWVLHAAYAWIIVHLLLRVGAAAGLVAESLAIHALTVGAIGGLTIGMMTRTARGHTARPLKADGYETTAYLLVLAAALARVFGPMAMPEQHLAFVQVSAVLWAAAFGLYAVRYWPILSRPRLDGKPG